LLQYLGLERPDWRSLVTLAVAATAALLVALTLYLGWTSRRHRRGDRAARSFARFAHALEAARVRPQLLGEGPQAYALHAAAALPRAAGEITAIVGKYLAARYEPDADGAALAELEQRVREFRPAT
jgi:hypothetical protein